MPWVDIATRALEFVWGQIRGSGPTGDPLARQLASDVFSALGSQLDNLANTVLWLAYAANSSWNASYAMTNATRLNMGAAQSATNLAVRHIVDVILPNSLQYLEGKVVSKHIGPLGHKIAVLNGLVGNAKSFRSTNLWGWRNTLADPTIRAFGRLQGDWTRFNGWLGGSASFNDVQMPGSNAKTVIWNSWWRWQDPNTMVGWFWSRRPSDRDARSITVKWLDRDDLPGARQDLIDLLLRRGSQEVPRAVIAAAANVLNADIG